MICLSVLFLVLLCAVSALADLGSEDIPITRVTLYTSGVGYFERSGTVEGDAQKTLLFPVGQVNDVLKSLVLLDLGGGSIRPVTYGALDPVSKQLQSFSVDVSDNPDRATLLNRLRGASVTVTSAMSDVAEKTMTGVVVGVESHTVDANMTGATTQTYFLNLLDENGLHTVPLASVSAVQINDPALNSELSAALATVAQGRDASKRPVTLNFSGAGRRSVVVGFLGETPLWQTSYRLVLGEAAYIQGWALVQNTSQGDWADVALSLVSGRPSSFVQDLYTPTYVPRPVVKPRVSGAPTPQTYGSDLDAGPVPASPPLSRVDAAMDHDFGVLSAPVASAPRSSPQPAMMRRGGAVPEPDPSGMTAGAIRAMETTASGAQLGTSLFAYNIEVPVSIARQQSAMIPFLGAEIEAERVSIYNASRFSDHPLSGLRLKNTTGLHLMGGPLTIFDSDTSSRMQYVGEALMDDTEPEQTRLLSYAVDLAVDADPGQQSVSKQTVSLRIAQSALTAHERLTVARIYTFKNHAAQPRRIVLEHRPQGLEPRRRQDQWNLVEPAEPDERTKDVYRFNFDVIANESRKFTVTETAVTRTSFHLLQTPLETLMTISQEGAASEAVQVAIAEVRTRSQAVHEANAEIGDIDVRLGSFQTGQERIRKNMKELDHGSELYKRYVADLDSQETTIGELETRKDALIRQREDASKALNDYVSDLTIE